MYYKLTDKDGNTYNNTHWEAGTTHIAQGTPNGRLCSSGYIHFYKDPYLAIFANPIQGEFDEKTMLLWEFDATIVLDSPIKSGCTQGTTIRTISKPQITSEQRVSIAIRCSLVVYKKPSYVEWAKNWLSGKDKAAYAAANAASAAAYAADAAANAASAAAYAAYAAANAANAATTSAAYAASAAANANPELNVIKIIHEVLNV